MTKSELRTVIQKLLKEELEANKILKENSSHITSAYDDKIVDACLGRIYKNADYTITDNGDELDKWISVGITKEDLKKALKVGTNLSHGRYDVGMTIPAQIVDSADLVIYYDYEDSTLGISFELHGDCPDNSDCSVNDYLDSVPIIGKKVITLKNIYSNSDVLSYIKSEIAPNADVIVHEIIEQAWKQSGYTDYSGITDYSSIE